MSSNQNKWKKSWTTEKWLEHKNERFQVLNEYLSFEPKRILDIGCGLAIESGLFQRKYGTELWLLDSGRKDEKNTRDSGYYGKASKFAFYLDEEYLKKSWDERGLKYKFVDANDIQIPSDVKFDLIYSLKSCGFHYSIKNYVLLLKKHSDENTTMIFDFHRPHYEEQMKDTFEQVGMVEKGRDRWCMEIKLN